MASSFISLPTPLLYLMPMVSTSWLSGAIVSISIISMPGLSSPLSTSSASAKASPRAAESHTLTAWKTLYEAGARTAPAIAAVSAITSFLNAYSLYNANRLESAMFAVGGGLMTIGIAPFTFMVLLPTNNKLIRREAVLREGREEAFEVGVKEEGGESTKSLLGTWSTLNTIRGLLPLVGTFLASQAF